MKKRGFLILAVCLTFVLSVTSIVFAREEESKADPSQPAVEEETVSDPSQPTVEEEAVSDLKEDSVQQYASAHLNQFEKCVDVVVDLSDGWSVHFAASAFYLYDGNVDGEEKLVAMGLTPGMRVFQYDWAFALKSESCREIPDGLFFIDEDQHGVYLVRVGEDACFKLNVSPEYDSDDVFNHVQVERGMDYVESIDYLALVNKENVLPEGWEDLLDTVHITNSVGDDVEVESKAFIAYLKLAYDLAQNDGIYVELDSARRSVAEQQRIMESFTEKYGEEYARATVATPGFSEHHTGLALDLYFRIKKEDGSFTDVYLNEDMEKEEYKGIWEAIHAKLAKYGFILRYLEGKEDVTGYRYEPWHIRYVDSVSIAQEIMSMPGLTLEEYLAGFGTSENGWNTEGFFFDEKGNMLSITWMGDVDEPGWYVGCMLGEDFMEDSWGGILPEEENKLHGSLPTSGSKNELVVTISKEGENGICLEVEGGETYHFLTWDIPEATIMVNINTEGWGNIEYAMGEEAPEIDEEYPYQSAYIGLAEPATYTFLAWPEAGYTFVKWTKNGEDFSDEAQITLLLDESADYIAVFEEDPDWESPLTPYLGEYQSGRAHATLDSVGDTDLWITIEWGNSAWELARWNMAGRFDPETSTIQYTGCSKMIVTYDEGGELKSQEPEYEDGSGTIVFHEDGTFTWHEDQAEREEDLVFEKLPDMEE